MSVRCDEVETLLSSDTAYARDLAVARARWTPGADGERHLAAARRRMTRNYSCACPRVIALCPLRSYGAHSEGCEIVDDGRRLVQAALLEVVLDFWRSDPASTPGPAGNPVLPAPTGDRPERLRRLVERLRDHAPETVFPGVRSDDLVTALHAAQLVITGAIPDPAAAVVKASEVCELGVDPRSDRGKRRHHVLLADTLAIVGAVDGA